MEYKLGLKIDNIDYFVSEDSFLGYKTKKREVVLNDDFHDNITSFEQSNNIVYLYSEDETIIRYPNKTIDKIAARITPFNFYYPDKFIKSFDKQTENEIRSSKWAIYQLKPLKKLYELPHRYVGSGYIFGDMRIQNETELLKSLSLLTGEYDWEVDLGGYGEINKVIGVCKNILWVSCGYKILLGIAVTTGKIIHEIDKATHIAYKSGELKYFRGHDGQLDVKANKIMGFEYDTYYELDLTDLSFIYWVFSAETKSMDLEARYAPQNVHIDGYIFFIDKLNAKIGVFDIETKKIELIYSLQESLVKDMPDLRGVKVGFLNDLQVTEDKLYALTTDGVLLIFERDI